MNLKRTEGKYYILKILLVLPIEYHFDEYCRITFEIIVNEIINAIRASQIKINILNNNT